MIGVVLAAALASAEPGAARRFDLQGHRGARGLAPENTLAAFARALTLGVTTLELDLAVTRDGVVVVSHDPALNPDVARGPDGRWVAAPGPALFTLTRAEVLSYDVGRLRPESHYAAQFPDQVPQDGQRIPTLEEVYALARKAGNESVRFNVETKIDPTKPAQTLPPEAFTDAVLAVVREAGAESRTTIQSFDWRTLRRVQETAPAVTTVCLTDRAYQRLTAAEPSPWLAGLRLDDVQGSLPRLVKAAGAPVWSPNARELDGRAVAEAHALGLKVIPWTVNRPADMKTIIALGVDGLISDRPDLLRAVMEELGLPLPPPTPVTP